MHRSNSTVLPASARRPGSVLGQRGSARAAVLLLLATAGGTAMAADYGRVVSSTPVMAQVPMPQQACRDEQQWVQPRTSGGGAVIGALLGGAIGNAFGAGGGRALATGLGVVAGAAVGNQAEANNYPAGVATVRNCQTVTSYQNQVVGYDVVYDYNGQRYSTRTAQDPGRQIALDVSVTPSAGWQPVPSTASLPQPVYAEPAAYPAPVYGGYGYAVPSAVVAPSVYIGVGGGYRHGGYWR